MEITKDTNSGDAWRDKVRLIREMEDDWQHYQAAVCDETTPASQLETIAYAFLDPSPTTRNATRPHSNNTGNRVRSGGGIRVLEAIAGHPNTPPRLLAEIVVWEPEASRAFCQNPLTPFLPLEVPFFAAELFENGQLSLLREAALSPTFVSSLQQTRSQQDVQNAARLHVALAGEIGPSENWQDVIRDYWKHFCMEAQDHDQQREWHIDLAEVELAPAWAKGLEPIPEPGGPFSQIKTYALLEEWFAFAVAPQSSEETALLRRIGPTLSDLTVLARALRKNAAPADLIAALDAPGGERGLVRAAVLHHPNATAAVVEKIANGKTLPRFERLTLMHLQTPQTVIKRYLSSTDPAWRRLARRHPNAPSDAADVSRQALAGLVKNGTSPLRYPFVSFVLSLHFGSLHHGVSVVQKAESLYWTHRLEAVLLVVANPAVLNGDFAGRTPTDLFHHLALDGNRLVRAAARAFLADPNTRFVL